MRKVIQISIVYILLLCASCSYFSKNRANDIERMNKDSVFLDIKGNLLEEPSLLWKNKDVYDKALERMEKHLSIVNGRFKWDITSGKSINVSENLYDYIVQYWNHENSLLEDEDYMILRFKANKRCLVVPKTTQKDTIKWERID